MVVSECRSEDKLPVAVGERGGAAGVPLVVCTALASSGSSVLQSSSSNRNLAVFAVSGLGPTCR